MIPPELSLALMLIGLVMTFPLAIFESRNPRPKDRPLEPRRIALMSLGFTGTLLSLFASAALFLTLRAGG
jgi:hypothetical protein